MVAAADGGERGRSWYLSKEEIKRGSPSRRDNMGAAKEAQLWATYCSFIRDVDLRLKLPQITTATGMLLCHRFYLHQSHAKNEWQILKRLERRSGVKNNTPVQLILDTGSDLVWTQCQPCRACINQSLPYFNPPNSSTFSVLPCHQPMCQQNLDWSSCGNQYWGNQTCVYVYSYADNDITTGHLDTGTFMFLAADGVGSASVPGLAFGCGLFNSGNFQSDETGTAGFGRGALSLPSQLKVDNFSHSFTPITGSEPSAVLLGIPANLYGYDGGIVQSTPLIQNTTSPNAYYVSLKCITVGSTRLEVPESVFAMKNDGSGGTIIDSGTGMTSLPLGVYNLVHDNSTTVASQLCFLVPPQGKPDVPKLMLHLEGATLDLPRENYMFELEEAGRNITCLAVDTWPDLTIIGNYQQQNMHVLYDLANNFLPFVLAQCDRL